MVAITTRAGDDEPGVSAYGDSVFLCKVSWRSGVQENKCACIDSSYRCACAGADVLGRGGSKLPGATSGGPLGRGKRDECGGGGG